MIINSAQLLPENFIDTTTTIAPTANQVSDGKEFFVNGNKIIGALSVNTPINSTITTPGGSVIIPAGYYETQGKVTAGSNLIDTSNATATAADLYKDKTAYANGSKITGTYQFATQQASSSTTGCSTSQLKIQCDFQPNAIAVVTNSEQRKNNTILAIWAGTAAYVTISIGTKASLSDTYPIARTQITSNVSNYWYYSGGYVYIKKPNSTYNFDSNNYRIFLMR